MANYYTLASMLLPVGSPENAQAAMGIHEKMTEEASDRDELFDFEATVRPDEPAAVWICSDESFSPEHVVAFALACAKEFKLTGLWGFEWASTCSRPLLDGYGGGAVAVNFDTRRVRWINTGGWLAKALKPRQSKKKGQRR